MPRTTRNKNISETITPLYVLAGAGDLAVEKIREISRMASSKISSLETTDPAEVSDRMQVRLEEGADTLGVVIRSATSDIREQAKGISGRAQSAMQAMWMSAGDAYEDLIERGEGVMSHLRGQNGRTIQRAAAGARGGRSTAAKKAGRSAGKATGTKSTAKKSASKTAGRSTTKSASKSTRSASKSTTRKRAASKGGRANSSSSANTRKSTASASKSAPTGAARPANSNTSAGTTTTSTSSTPMTNSSTSS